MLNFTVGPVMSEESILSIGAEQTPYFRTAEFSTLMLENEELILKFTKSPKLSRAVFMTGSGTLSMEAVVMNVLSPLDNVLVVNGGSFGLRFAQMLKIHRIPYTEIKPKLGYSITADDLVPYEGGDFSAFMVNLDETSVGVIYDIELISSFCRRNNLLLIVDSISSFLCDPFDMDRLGADVMITGSQKALACPPGVSIIVLSPRAVERVEKNEPKIMYMDLRAALKDQERGQTPFTCAVSILIQINRRLKNIDIAGGVDSEVERIGNLARYFRDRIVDLPFKIFSHSLPNAVTPLSPKNKVSAYDIFTKLKDEYGIWVCPNGGEMKNKIFRVGHIGALTTFDFDILISAFHDMEKRGLL